MVKVLLNDILFIEGLNDYVKIIQATRTIVTKSLISSLEQTLPKEAFIRIHRSYIAAISKIDSFNADTIQIGNKELPIGRLFKHDVTKLLNSLSIHRGTSNHSKNNSGNE
jgi:DNA-binding LytR/AlgR family response regulator